jgi:hypothetical protein
MQWLMLLHQIPPSPPYLRAKVMRRLTRVGALAVKNSAYLLPAGDEAREDFEWLRREIEQGGGEAWIFECAAVAGLSDESIRGQFRGARAADFAVLAAEARQLLATPDEPRLRRLNERYQQVRRIDYFGAPGREELEALMKEMDRPGEWNGRTWVTRKGVKVDRIASVWLIRRFIDPGAKFAFVDPQVYAQDERSVRFDMFEGEFTHEGDECTFEVLRRRFQLEHTGLTVLAEVVHDIDLKDGKFQRPETAGVEALIDGIAARHSDDLRRIEEGSTVFDALYARAARA